MAAITMVNMNVNTIKDKQSKQPIQDMSNYRPGRHIEFPGMLSNILQIKCKLLQYHATELSCNSILHVSLSYCFPSPPLTLLLY